MIENMSCPHCGFPVEIKQPSSEYTPAGTCKNCGTISAMLYYIIGRTELYTIGNIDLPKKNEDKNDAESKP